MKKSFLAGILIGLGVIVNTQMEYKPLGALLFSFGLVTIINMKLLLFTGKVGYLVNGLLPMLFFNLLGIAATVGLYAFSNPAYIDIISAAAAAKFSKNIITLFINAVFCGALIHFAVKNKNIVITIFAVVIFILIGAEHCIADFPYLIFNLSWMNTLKLIAIILGNSAGAIFIEELSK